MKIDMKVVLFSFLVLCGAVVIAGLAVTVLPSGDADASEPPANQQQVLRVPGSTDLIRVIKIDGYGTICVLYDGYESVAIDCLEGS